MSTSNLNFDGLKAIIKAEHSLMRERIHSAYSIDFLTSELINALHQKGLPILAGGSKGEGIASPRLGKVGQFLGAKLAGDQSEKVV